MKGSPVTGSLTGKVYDAKTKANKEVARTVKSKIVNDNSITVTLDVSKAENQLTANTNYTINL